MVYNALEENACTVCSRVMMPMRVKPRNVTLVWNLDHTVSPMSHKLRGLPVDDDVTPL
jgi:hypothetical protein